MKKDETDKVEEDKDDPLPELKVDDAVYKFPRNFVTNEILNIMEDLLQGPKIVAAPINRK